MAGECGELVSLPHGRQERIGIGKGQEQCPFQEPHLIYFLLLWFTS